MSSQDHLVPETKVLAIASHVKSRIQRWHQLRAIGQQDVFGSMTDRDDTEVLLEILWRHSSCNPWDAMTSADEVKAMYQGICESGLDDFDVMLTGYAPTAAVVEALGDIAMDLKKKSEKAPGSFFW
ncbi:putative pyridoxal kinase, partial [Ascosphaera pollenicola]